MRGALLAALLAANASAELTLDAAGWQSGRVEKPARPAVWTDAERAAIPAKKAPLLRGKAVLKNRGPKAAEGVLLRYTVQARLITDKPGAAGEAQWALPFLIDERRVPKVDPNSVLDVPLSLSPKLDIYIKKVKRQGMRVNMLKLQAMLEPHAADGAVKVVETLLEVVP